MTRKGFFATIAAVICGGTPGRYAVAQCSVGVPMFLPMHPKVSAAPESFRGEFVELAPNNGWRNSICVGISAHFRDGRSEYFTLQDVDGTGINSERWRTLIAAYEAKRNITVTAKTWRLA